MLELKFVCKDALLERYYQNRFGRKFTAQALETEDPVALRQQWIDEMTDEARRQEHYDYEVIDRDAPAAAWRQRRTLYDEQGQPKLLIPTVEVRAAG